MNADPREWAGVYYDGLTAGRHAVRITVDAALTIHLTDGSSVTIPFDELRQTQGQLSSEDVRLEFGTEPARVLLVRDRDFAAALRATSPAARRVLKRRWQTSRIAAWSIGAVVAAVALYVWGAPAASAWLAQRLPPSIETSMGESVASQITTLGGGTCTDSVSLRAMRQVLDRLVSAVPRTPYTFRVVVLRDTTVNAFAAPGGLIAVNAGLLRAAKTPEELAGVLAHEIQHVVHRHSTRAIIRELPLRVAIAGMSGGSGADALVGLAGSVGALTYRRADEAEADRDGLELMAAAHVDPSAMVSFMKTLDAREPEIPGMVTFLSNHPQTADRVAELDALARSRLVTVQPLLDSLDWERARRGCAAPAG